MGSRRRTVERQTTMAAQREEVHFPMGRAEIICCPRLWRLTDRLSSLSPSIRGSASEPRRSVGLEVMCLTTSSRASSAGQVGRGYFGSTWNEGKAKKRGRQHWVNGPGGATDDQQPSHQQFNPSQRLSEDFATTISIDCRFPRCGCGKKG